MSESTATVPDLRAFMNPCLAVLQRADCPLTNEQTDEAVAAEMKLGSEVLSVLHDAEKNPKAEAFYRLSWARTYLKKVGLIDNPKRGQWEATPKGRSSGPVDPTEIVRWVTTGADADSLSVELNDALADEILELYPLVAEERSLPELNELRACYSRFNVTARAGPPVIRPRT